MKRDTQHTLLNSVLFNTGSHVSGSPGVILMSADFWDPRSTGSEFMDRSGNQNLKVIFGGSDIGSPQVLL